MDTVGAYDSEDDEMDIQDRYTEYADAFEQTYEDDDWSRIAQYFTANAVYEGDPVARGRDAVLERLKNSVNGFDRRMDSRTVKFEKPTVDGDTVTVKWKATYTKNGLPNLEISGKEFATFEGNRIAILRGEFDTAAQQAMGDWMQKHGKALQG
jgi:SnoaL-like domain